MSRAWSSADGVYVGLWPSDNVTRISNENELNDVLRPYGLTLPAPTEADYSDAIQAHIDAAAQSRGYGDGYALASYASSTIQSWASEAAAFIGWRDSVWLYAYGELAKVQSGQRPKPTITGLIGELPAIAWPS